MPAVRQLATDSKDNKKGKEVKAASDVDAPPVQVSSMRMSARSLASSGDDMLSDAQREKSFAARKLTLPPHEARLAGAPDLYSACKNLSSFPKADIGKYYKLENTSLVPDTIIKPLLGMSCHPLTPSSHHPIGPPLPPPDHMCLLHRGNENDWRLRNGSIRSV